VLVVGVPKAQAPENTLGSGVARLMTREEALSPEGAERVTDDCVCGLGSETVTPVEREKIEAKLEHLLRGTVRAKATAPHEGAAGGEKHGTILKP